MTPPRFTDVTGLAGIALVASVVVLSIPGLRQRSWLSRLGIFVALMLLWVIPFRGLPLVAYVRGVTGDLSMATLVLSCSGAAWRVVGWQPLARSTRWVTLALIATGAMALYPMALGLSSFDPYRLGYGSPWLVGALLLLALGAWILRFTVVTAWLTLSILAWTLQWYESTNLWDYLLDPLVSIYALADLVCCGVAALRHRSRWMVRRILLSPRASGPEV